MRNDDLPVPPLSDEELIELYRQGHDSALDQLYIRYSSWATKKADYLVKGDPGGSERILIKSWARYARKLRRYPDRTLPVRFEVGRFLKNEAYTWWELRVQVRFFSLDQMSKPVDEGGQAFTPVSSNTSLEEDVERRTVAQQIIKAFDNVPDQRWKAVFEARDIHGLEGEQVEDYLRQQGIEPPPKSTLSEWYTKAITFIRGELGLQPDEFTTASRGRRRRK